MIPLRNMRRFVRKARRQPLYAAGVFARRARSYAWYRFGRGRSSPPEAITLFLTRRCNLKCRMCGQWGREGIAKKQSSQYITTELGLDELQRLIEGVSSFRPNITLFGGEPLLHRGCIALIRYIKERHMHCLMITNGFLIEEAAGAIVAAGLDEINVSIDGDAALHDEIRGMPGLFDTIMRGLKKLDAAKRALNKKRPYVNLQCTMTRDNYRFLDRMIGVAREASADSLTFHNLIFLDKTLLERQKAYDAVLGCGSQDWEGFAFEPEIDPDTLYEHISGVLAGAYPFNVDVYPNFSLKGIREYYAHPSSMPAGYPARCLSPWMVAYIFPDGEVRPCLNLDYSYGNIKRAPLGALWNNERAVRFRAMLKQNKIFPVCPRCTELYRY